MKSDEIEIPNKKPDEWIEKRRLEIRESGSIALEMLTKMGMKVVPLDSPVFDWHKEEEEEERTP